MCSDIANLSEKDKTIQNASLDETVSNIVERIMLSVNENK